MGLCSSLRVAEHIAGAASMLPNCEMETPAHLMTSCCGVLGMTAFCTKRVYHRAGTRAGAGMRGGPFILVAQNVQVCACELLQCDIYP